MEKRKLGTQGLEVSLIGLGCMGMSEFYGTSDEKECLTTLYRSLDLGINFFDTADSYGPFTNEELIGKFIRSTHKQIIIATKFGIQRSIDSHSRKINGEPEYVRASCDASLRRLGIDCIDLYYQHRVDPNVPIEETVGAMSALVKEGKVKYIGLSEAGSSTIRRAHEVHPITAIQSEYSLWSREPEDDVINTIRELGIGLVAYSPLGRGFLTGNIRNTEELAENDYRRYTPRFVGEHFKKNLKLLQNIEKISKQIGCTPGQLALSWVLAQGNDIVPIPGTKRVKFLQENINSLKIKLNYDQLKEIDSVFPKNVAAGFRYPEEMLKYING